MRGLLSSNISWGMYRLHFIMRARNIKPGFFKNEDLIDLPFEFRLLFQGLWCMADRKGRLEDRPKRIKFDVFPGDNVDVEEGLRLLSSKNFIVRYSINNNNYIQIVKWKENQSPHNTEKESVIPALTNESITKVERLETHSHPPESLIMESLITESGIMNQERTTLSGKPDQTQLIKNKEFLETAREVVLFLNEKTGRNYEPKGVNLDMIVARLKEGATLKNCRQIIAKKSREWSIDEKMSMYLRPKTLFNKTNFAQYKGELLNLNEVSNA